MAAKNLKPASNTSMNSAAASEKRRSGAAGGRRSVKNNLIVWLDANVTASSEDSQRTLEQLRSVINDVNLFADPEECLTFLENIEPKKIFLITSGSLGRTLVPRIHPVTHIEAIYIFCGDKSRHEEWVKKWPKIKGVYTEITPLCQTLELAVKEGNQDVSAVSFAQVDEEGASDINLNQLEPSFMYTQLFKKTLLDMEHDKEKAVRDLVRYCREKYAEDTIQLNLIEEFGRDYRANKAIWWYTRDGFIYQMLNRALRLLEADIIVNMGFFIHDLHRQIQQLHSEQVDQYGGKPFLVYRGQSLSMSDFEKLKKSQGALMSFNCFLSTSRKKELASYFAKSAAMDNDSTGILFIMTIDPNTASVPFADIQRVEYFQEESTILFSMHTVFRIRTIKPIDEDKRLFEVHLTLTNDDDAQLRTLLEQIDEDVRTSNGWERMGKLLIKVGELDKAEEVFHTLLEQTSNPDEKDRYYHQLGDIKSAQGDYQEAVRYYERGLEIKQKRLPKDHPSLADFYNSIGAAYDNIGEYLKALSFLERALEIKQKNLPINHPSLADSYDSIGAVYRSLGEYPKALSFLERALEIKQKSLPASHPSLADSHDNIGTVYKNMGKHAKALSYLERALEIRQRSLPANHPSLADSYDNIGTVYKNMGEHAKALSYLERALEIRQRSLPADHPHLLSVSESVETMKKKLNKK